MIAIIGAMDEEVAMLKERMTEVQVERWASMEFYKGKLEGKDTVVVRSGIGKVNAAMCAQLLADRYAPSCIINTGIAGSLDAEINIGDIVLSTDALQHDMDAGAFGYEAGQIPRAVWFLGTSLFLIRRKRSGFGRHFPVCVQRWKEPPLLRYAILTGFRF